MIAKCETCGKEYYIRPSHYKRVKRHFCSKKCLGIGERGEKNPAWKKPKICLYCKKKFKGKGKKYCSRKCMGLDKRNRIETKCENCGKKITRINFYKGKKHFCSLKCAGKTQSKKLTKDGNPNWRGGIGKLPWGYEFTNKLKREIRERDNYTCQICDKSGRSVHHIDYDKNNNKKNNLITLCSKCQRTVKKIRRIKAKSNFVYNLSVKKNHNYFIEKTLLHNSPNVIEDESALINNNSQSKIFRMLGDHPNNFYMKVGNPFNNNHFKKAYLNKDYYHINIDYHQGIKEGRTTESFINETKKNANFGVLYENIFPDEEGIDERGWLTMFSDKLVTDAQVEEGTVEPWGFARDGCDPADSGDNKAVIARRWSNLAKIMFASPGINNIQFATEIALRNRDVEESIIDNVGVGSGTYNTLSGQMSIKRRIQPINAGWAVPKIIKEEEREQYFNLRAYLFWMVKLWLEAGNKLVRDDGWKTLLEVRYNTNNSKGRVQIIKKEDLRRFYQVNDLGEADALSFTFLPSKPRIRHSGVVGGVQPINKKLGF